MSIRLYAIGFVVAAIGMCSGASATPWQVERVAGTAWAISKTSEPVVLRPNMMVAEGLTVATAPNGRLRITRNGDVLTLSPDTALVIVPGAAASSMTRVVQRSGKVEVAAATRPAPGFSVETPFLAAVVKGTRFTVDISDRSSSIVVEEGLVQVKDYRSGETADVGAGQSASAGFETSGLSVAGPRAPDVVPGRPAKAPVAPVGQLPVTAAQTAPAQNAEPSQGFFSRLSASFAASNAGRAESAAGPSSTSDSSGHSEGGRGTMSDPTGRGEAERASSDDPSDDSRGGRDAASGSGGDENGNENNDVGNGQGNNGNGGPNGDGNGNGGPNGNGNGGGNGQGNNGNGNGNGGPNGDGNGGGNGQGNNGNGNGNGGPNGNGNGGGNGQGNNGNGNGNGGPNGNGNGGGNDDDDDDDDDD